MPISDFLVEGEKKILVAPLNWGLGHAARDIPIICELLQRNIEVIIAADGRPLELLRKEFPQLKWIRLPGYDISYQKEGSFSLQIIRQIPYLFQSYFGERRRIKKIIADEKLDAIISDNRFGLFSRTIPCAFITHQVGIIMPKPFKWFEGTVYSLNKFLIEKFDQCWIPDAEGEKNLAGILSHKYPKPKNAVCIGPLSRFIMKPAEKKYDVLIVLSGQEPQRTIIEERLAAQAKQLEKKILLVRGVTEGTNEIKPVTGHFSVTDYMTANQLNDAFLSSEIIVARSGYSTVMDVVALGKKAIFIPTPGQTEQEELSNNFMRRKLFYSAPQKDFYLAKALEESKSFNPPDLQESKSDLFKEVLEKFLNRLK